MIISDIIQVIGSLYFVRGGSFSIEVFKDGKPICWAYIDEFGTDGRGEGVIITNEDYHSLYEKRKQGIKDNTIIVRTTSDNFKDEIIQGIKHFENQLPLNIQ